MKKSKMKFLTSVLLISLLLSGSTILYSQIDNAYANDNSDFEVILPSNAHVYISYDPNWTDTEKQFVNDCLSTYLPMMCNEFWSINQSAYVKMIKWVAGESPYSIGGGGSITKDQQGKVIFYNGTIRMSSPFNTVNWLSILLHEWTHVFQFWIPNYLAVIGIHLEAVAKAFANALILENLGWGTPEYTTTGSRDRGQLIDPQTYGIGMYLYSSSGRGYSLNTGWEELWFYDNQAYLKFNNWVATQTLANGEIPKLRDSVKTVLFQNYPNHVYDGLSVDDWLDSFSFFNSLEGFQIGTKAMMWEGVNEVRTLGLTIQFVAAVFSTPQNGLVTKVNITDGEITIRDAQTRETLYWNTNYPSSADKSIFFDMGRSNVSIPSRNLLRVDLIAHLEEGGNISCAGYIGQRYDPIGEKLVVFLNKEGFAEGAGNSNMGVINAGVLRWKDGKNLYANVSWLNNSYSYVVENIMAHPNIELTQIAVPLYASRTIISPVFQSINPNNPAKLEVHINPLVSTGTVGLYESTDLKNWTKIAVANPTNGYAEFDVELSLNGTYYFKASWDGDGVLDPSESSAVNVYFGQFEPLPTPVPTPIILRTPSPAPLLTPTPTATPIPVIPEFPSWTALQLIATAVSVSVLVYVQKRRATRQIHARTDS